MAYLDAHVNQALPGLAIGTALVAIALAVTLGAAQLMRGPDAASAPVLPAVPVTMGDGRILNVQPREVSIAQWQECHDAGACTLDFKASGRSGDYPATGLSFPDAMEFVAWVNARSDVEWRLPSSAEWHELAAEVMPRKPDPIFSDPALTWASTYLMEANATGRTLRPGGSYSATSAGIEDLSGNVWEWTRDCYAGASGQGDTADISRCPAFIMGGEHEAVMSYLVRDPARGGCAVGAPPAHLGMRLVSEIR